MVTEILRIYNFPQWVGYIGQLLSLKLFVQKISGVGEWKILGIKRGGGGGCSQMVDHKKCRGYVNFELKL